jgi:hypothetical protein
MDEEPSMGPGPPKGDLDTAAREWSRSGLARSAAIVVAVVGIGLVAASALGFSKRLPVGFPFGPRPGDPSLVASDPRLSRCGVPSDRVWLAFTMGQARDFSRHFPGWSAGAPELEVDDPALVVMSQGEDISTTGFAPSSPRPLFYEMCIAVGPPSDAIVHQYGWTRFDAVRPSLNGPLVPLP